MEVPLPCQKNSNRENSPVHSTNSLGVFSLGPNREEDKQQPRQGGGKVGLQGPGQEVNTRQPQISPHLSGAQYHEHVCSPRLL